MSGQIRIQERNIESIRKCLDAALSMRREWMAFDASRQSQTPAGLYFFEFKREAMALCEEHQRSFNNWQVIQVGTLKDIIEDFKKVHHQNESLGIQAHRGIQVELETAINWRLTQPPAELKTDLVNEKQSIMNTKNFDYLKDNLKYMGFGEKQHEALEANLKEGKDSFQLTFNADVNKKPFEAVLQFRKSDNSDMYFLNSYHATLERSNGEKKDQTFYLNKGKGVTAKEAYNLLEGRPVFKELTNKQNEPYKAWIQLDFENKDKHNNHEVKQFHENYGYDLKAAVGKYAVKELDGGDNEKKLLQSLEKGNIQSVSIEKDGTAVKMFIEANPQYKTVTLYDEQMKRVQKESLGQYQSVQPMNGKEVKQSSQEEKQETKQDVKLEKNTNKKKKDDIEDSLLPKKRNRQKKGLGLG